MRRLLVLVALLCAAMCATPAAGRADVVDDNPFLLATRDGTLHLFVRGSTGTLLYRTSVNGAWGAWSEIGARGRIRALGHPRRRDPPALCPRRGPGDLAERAG